MSKLLAAALAYAQMGIAVFPLRPGQKKPYGFTTGLHGATSDPDLVGARWRGEADLPLRPAEPDETLPERVRASLKANVAIATGPVSGLWVLDLDGPGGEASIAALESVHGALPVTVEQVTPGGRHMCFKWDPRFHLKISAGKVGFGIDVRGDGGYIVAPPSVHPGDVKREIPRGLIYAWALGRSPDECVLADAPEWLLKMAMPEEASPARAAPRPARTVDSGRASRYGEACLSTACRLVATAPAGTQQDTLWRQSCFVGGLIGGREIEEDYGRRALVDAGMRMVAAKKPWSEKDVRTHVERGIEAGKPHPKTAPERRSFEPAERHTPRQAAAPTPAEQATGIQEARSLWAGARDADCGLVRTWFRVRGLDVHALPGAIGRMRAHPAVTIADRAKPVPALLIRLVKSIDDFQWGEPVDAVAILPLTDVLADEGRARLDFRGETAGRVALLTDWPDDGALLVALDLEDAWTLGVNAHENGHELGVVLAPSLRAFAGRALGDRFGRVDPDAPHLDPAHPPWTVEGERAVFVALRGDIRSAELRRRLQWGGTERLQLKGEAAARYYGGLAEQGWRKAGADPVRILRPSDGSGFNPRPRVAAGDVRRSGGA